MNLDKDLLVQRAIKHFTTGKGKLEDQHLIMDPNEESTLPQEEQFKLIDGLGVPSDNEIAEIKVYETMSREQLTAVKLGVQAIINKQVTKIENETYSATA